MSTSPLRFKVLPLDNCVVRDCMRGDNYRFSDAIDANDVCTILNNLHADVVRLTENLLALKGVDEEVAKEAEEETHG